MSDDEVADRMARYGNNNVISAMPLVNGCARLLAVIVAACISTAAIAADAVDPAVAYQQSITKIPLDLTLAQHVKFPMSLMAIQKMLGSPGMILEPTLVSNTETHRWTSYTHGASIGDFFVQHDQVIGLWFEAPNFSTIVKNSNGRFTVVTQEGALKILSTAIPGSQWPPE